MADNSSSLGKRLKKRITIIPEKNASTAKRISDLLFKFQRKDQSASLFVPAMARSRPARCALFPCKDNPHPHLSHTVLDSRGIFCRRVAQIKGGPGCLPVLKANKAQRAGRERAIAG